MQTNKGLYIVITGGLSILVNIILGFLLAGANSDKELIRKEKDTTVAAYIAQLNATNLLAQNAINKYQEGLATVNAARKAKSDFERDIKGLEVQVQTLTDELTSANKKIKETEEGASGSVSDAQRAAKDAQDKANAILSDGTSITVRNLLLDGGIFADLIESDSKSITLRLARLNLAALDASAVNNSGVGTLGGAPEVPQVVRKLSTVKVSFADAGSDNFSDASTVNATSTGKFTIRIPARFSKPVVIKIRE